MFEKEIYFSAHEHYFELKEDYPTPIKVNIPEWYKKLEHTLQKKTIKGCMPFLDTLTTGYLLKMPQDFFIKHNIENDKGQKDSYHRFPTYEFADFIVAKQMNLNTSPEEVHPSFQLEGSPLIEKNKNLPFYKIINPWKITTPKGYSCLFVPPLNNSDDRFSIIPGIVDTDQYGTPVNFPIVINGDKYPFLETTIKKGTPYVQVIPFKRDNWKMIVKSIDQNQMQQNRIRQALTVLKHYNEGVWVKKSWK